MSESLATRLVDWQRQYGRHDLPWQRDRTPYRVWLSEIMLQQTQVQTVIGYFERFVARFTNVHALAKADLDEVLHLWTGLGYYSRARNLHAAAKQVVAEHDGELPREQEALVSLPGVGRSTAAAILALAYEQPAAILDGNVKRVFARVHAEPGWPGETKVLKRLWAHAEAHLPETEVRTYTQALMDLGATVCTRRNPACEQCPLADRCEACAAGTQHLYPAPRPRRSLPERRTRFLIAEDERGRLMLERRPPQGIWGGLWCFPEIPPEQAPADYLQMLGLESRGPVETLAGLTHGFTHFRLHIEPLRIPVKARNCQVREQEDRHWYSAGDSTRIGVSAPVAKLLKSLLRD